MTRSRDVELANVYNLRDLGGYPTVDGTRQTRWHVLYRGAGLYRLAGADAGVVEALGLRTIIDLRTDAEVAATGGYPIDRLPGQAHHLPMIQGLWDHAGIDPDAPPEAYLLPRYEEMLVQGRTTIARSVELMAAPGGLPAVFYCAAGKDRTGVLAALVLEAIGVAEEHIVADFHLSKERVERIVERARARGEDEASSAMVAQPATVMAAPPAAMRLFLARVREAHGSAAGYLTSSGVTGAQLAALAAALLEPVPSA